MIFPWLPATFPVPSTPFPLLVEIEISPGDQGIRPPLTRSLSADLSCVFSPRPTLPPPTLLFFESPRHGSNFPKSHYRDLFPFHYHLTMLICAPSPTFCLFFFFPSSPFEYGDLDIFPPSIIARPISSCIVLLISLFSWSTHELCIAAPTPFIPVIVINSPSFFPRLY